MRAILLGAILTLVGFTACTPPLQTTWPKFHHDIFQTGLSQFSTSTNSGVQKWKFATGGAVTSSPAIADDGTIYVGSADFNLYAVKADGTLRWKFLTGGPVTSSPTIANNGTVYVGSGDGYLYAVNPSGSQQWKFLVGGGPVSSSPALAVDGTIYIGSANGYVHAVTPAGAQKWKFFIYPGPSVVRAPATAGLLGTIYIGAESPDFIALNPDGTQQWNFTHTGSPGTSSAAVGGGPTIYVGSQNHQLYALNADGSIKWIFSTGNNIVGSSPAIAPDGTIYVGSTDHYLYAVNPDGTQKWRSPTGAIIRGSSPVIGADGTVYVGSYDNYVWALGADGSFKWKFLTGGPIDSSPAIGADGTVYVGSADHYLYALGAPATPGTCCGPQQIVMQSIGSDGILKIGSVGPLPFPAGASITVDTGAAGVDCKHDAIVTGFTVPVYCIPALAFTTQITAVGCDGGGARGSGAVWDAGAPTADPAVTRVADTSDPDANTCAVRGTGCTTSAGGAGADTRGNINTTRGGSPLTGGRTHTRLDVPVHATVWAPPDGSCPDSDGVFNSTTDTLVADFDFMMSLTTGATSADFTDLNGDGCDRAGNGPDHTQHCSGDETRPCTTTSNCTSPMPDAGVCIDGPLTGVPAAGPCCTVGQPSTLVFTSASFMGSGPLFDVLVAGRIRTVVTQCNPAPPLATCVLTSNPCKD